MSMIGVIGGSGFYDFLESPDKKSVSTPFGDVQVEKGTINNKEVIFIPRHGKDHSIPPSQINYRGNIFAAHKLGVTQILTTNAVGSLDEDIGPGSFATPDQILDYTSGRDDTFFDGSGFSVTTNKGNEKSGVVHTDVTNPFSKKLREEMMIKGHELDHDIKDGGTLVVANGPRFETAAEIEAFRVLGGDYVGMTSSPEVFLAIELDIDYASLAVITNYASGMQDSVSAEEVFEIFSERIDVVKNLIKSTISNL